MGLNYSHNIIRVKETDTHNRSKAFGGKYYGARRGQMVGQSRDGKIAYIWWDGTKGSQAISKNFIEPENKENEKV